MTRAYPRRPLTALLLLLALAAAGCSRTPAAADPPAADQPGPAAPLPGGGPAPAADAAANANERPADPPPAADKAPPAIPLRTLLAAFGKEPDSDEVRAIAKLFPDPPTRSDTGSLSWKPHGLYLGFERGKGLTAIFLYAAGVVDGMAEYVGEMPLGLSFRDGRAGVEKKLGPPDEVTGSTNLFASYRKLGLNLAYRPARKGEPATEVAYVAISPDFRPDGQARTPPAPTGLPPGKEGPTFLDAAARYEGKTLAGWITGLGDADDLARYRAANAVAKYGPNAKAAVPALIGLLKNPDDLAFPAAAAALAAVGPAAGDAVEPLAALLKHPKADARTLAAVTLGKLGPPAGKAVPALIAALDAARSGTGADGDVFRVTIQKLGRYDVRAVFAAARRGTLNEVDLGFVIDSLGPGDAQAVDGLVEELKREDGGWVFHALGGLKRIGPKAAPALPAVRALLDDKSEGVRKSAAEAVAAIAPKADDPPPAAPRGGPAAAKGPGGPDPAVAAVFGSESGAYKEAGYKGVVLGTPFDELAKQKGLKLTRVGQPWVFASGPKGDEEFVFDADRKLVCYTRSYDGGPDDYLDKLVEVFGKTDRTPRETVSTSPTSVTRRVAVDYTFPKVLARVVFVKTAREGVVRGQPLVEEKTHVAVLDRAWAAGILDGNARGKRKAVGWVRAVGEKVKGGKVVLADLPKLDGADGREFPEELEVVRFYDAGREAANKGREEGDRLPSVVAAVERSARPDGSPLVRVHFVFQRYTPLATPKVFRQDDPQTGSWQPVTGNNALGYTSFDNLVTELNVAVVRDAFPPKGGRVEYVRPRSGASYYEWRTADGWAVRCRSDDAVTIEWVGEKGL